MQRYDEVKSIPRGALQKLALPLVAYSFVTHDPGPNLPLLLCGWPKSITLNPLTSCLSTTGPPIFLVFHLSQPC